MKEIVEACVNGVNGLVFTYGVTNAGKSFTIQGISASFMGEMWHWRLSQLCHITRNKPFVFAGCPKDGGILPRSLDMIFNYIGGRLYSKMNIKPCYGKLTKKLNEIQVKQEEAIKATLLASLKEVNCSVYINLKYCSLKPCCYYKTVIQVSHHVSLVFKWGGRGIFAKNSEVQI